MNTIYECMGPWVRRCLVFVSLFALVGLKIMFSFFQLWKNWCFHLQLDLTKLCGVRIFRVVVFKMLYKFWQIFFLQFWYVHVFVSYSCYFSCPFVIFLCFSYFSYIVFMSYNRIIFNIVRFILNVIWHHRWICAYNIDIIVYIHVQTLGNWE